MNLPEFSVLCLMGPRECGMLEFAKRNFAPEEILDLHALHSWVGLPEGELGEDAYKALATIAELRLKNRARIVVIGLEPSTRSRSSIRQLARKYHAFLATWVFLPTVQDLEPRLSKEKLASAAQALGSFQRELEFLSLEGFEEVRVISDLDEVDTALVTNTYLSCDLRSESGPFDIIGGIHGCHSILLDLLRKMGYMTDGQGIPLPPACRKLILLGDLADMGPEGPQVLETLMAMHAAGNALLVMGNQDRLLIDLLKGKEPDLNSTFEEDATWVTTLPMEKRLELATFLEQQCRHLVLDNGNLVAVHAAVKPSHILRDGRAVQNFCLYGETPGERKRLGFHASALWTEDFKGDTLVVHAHEAMLEPTWNLRTLNIDTGCVFGGKMTAFQYPEMAFVEVENPVAHVEAERFIPAIAELVRSKGLSPVHWEYLNGKYLIQTELQYTFSINAVIAEVAMQHFAMQTVDPRWIIYLPPSTSPPQPSKQAGFLEHIDEGFSYFEKKGMQNVLVREMLDGTAVVAVICKTPAVAKSRFGVEDGKQGCIYSKSGRPVPCIQPQEDAWISALAAAIEKAGLWSELGSDWVCLEGEFAGGSASNPQASTKWQGMRASAIRSASLMSGFLSAAPQDSDPAGLAIRQRLQSRISGAGMIIESLPDADPHMRFYVHGLVASEGKTHLEQPYDWHYRLLEAVCAQSPQTLQLAQNMFVELSDFKQRHAATNWFESISSTGRPGLLVKAMKSISLLDKEPIQSTIQVRGREALRLVYGMEYTQEPQLSHHRKRSLKNRRELVVRQLSLGQDALQNFVSGKPFEDVHKFVFLQLAISLSDEDPRI